MQVKSISASRHINLPDGQGMELELKGCVDTSIDMELAKLILNNVLNSGVITVLMNEIVKPIEKYSRPVHKEQVLEGVI